MVRLLIVFGHSKVLGICSWWILKVSINSLWFFYLLVRILPPHASSRWLDPNKKLLTALGGISAVHRLKRSPRVIKGQKEGGAEQNSRRSVD